MTVRQYERIRFVNILEKLISFMRFIGDSVVMNNDAFEMLYSCICVNFEVEFSLFKVNTGTR